MINNFHHRIEGKAPRLQMESKVQVQGFAPLKLTFDFDSSILPVDKAMELAEEKLLDKFQEVNGIRPLKVKAIV